MNRFADLEADLVDLGRHLDVHNLLAPTGARQAVPRWGRRALQLAAAVVLLLGALVAVGPSRRAIARFLGVGTVEIRPVTTTLPVSTAQLPGSGSASQGPTPAATPSTSQPQTDPANVPNPPVPSGPGSAPASRATAAAPGAPVATGATGSDGSDGSDGSSGSSGSTVTPSSPISAGVGDPDLGVAMAALPFRVRTSPRPLLGREVVVLSGAGMAILRYQGFTLFQVASPVNATFMMAKLTPPGTRVDFVKVRGVDAVWLAGTPHQVAMIYSDGAIINDTVRTVGNVLVWFEDGVTFRIEGVTKLADAQAIAESLR